MVRELIASARAGQGRRAPAGVMALGQASAAAPLGVRDVEAAAVAVAGVSAGSACRGAGCSLLILRNKEPIFWQFG
jgi:hypothetical protein